MILGSRPIFINQTSNRLLVPTILILELGWVAMWNNLLNWMTLERICLMWERERERIGKMLWLRWYKRHHRLDYTTILTLMLLNVLPIRLHSMQDIHEANSPGSDVPRGVLYSGSLKLGLRVKPH